MKLKALAAAAVSLTALLAAVPAQAIIVAYSVSAPTTEDFISQSGPSSWHYSFSVTNHSWWNPFLSNYGVADAVTVVDVYLPYFADAGITGITAPAGWTFSIDTQDLFHLGQGAETLHWHASSLAVGIAGTSVGSSYPTLPLGATLSGFSFDASYGPVKAPFEVGFAVTSSWNAGAMMGDPPLPGSPTTIAAGLDVALPLSPVPELPTWLTLMAGASALMGWRRKAGRLPAAA